MTDLAGTLLSFGLAPLLGFLGQLRKTGSLYISDGPLSGQVFLESGRVVGAMFGSEHGSAAFEAIVLVLGGGDFTLDENVTERELNFMVDPQVLDDHLRRLSEERARFANVLPSLAVVPSLSLSGAADDEVTVNVAALRVLLEVDGRRSVLDLARNTGLVAAARSVARLVEVGLVTVQPIDAAPAPGQRPASSRLGAGRFATTSNQGRPAKGNPDLDNNNHPTRRWFDGRGPGHG